MCHDHANINDVQKKTLNKLQKKAKTKGVFNKRIFYRAKASIQFIVFYLSKDTNTRHKHMYGMHIVHTQKEKSTLTFTQKKELSNGTDFISVCMLKTHTATFN